MIIYNVTIKVDAEIAKDWLQWLREEHIPDMLGTGCFHNATLLELLDTDDGEGPTYAIQYESPGRESLDRYLADHAQEMRARGYSRWGDRFTAFRSLLKVIN